MRRTLPTIPILVGLGSLMPLGMHVVLPALPAMARDLDTSVATTQWTVTLFMLAVAFGQLVYGPVSDRYGRLPPLFVGLAVFCAGSLVCALAPSTTVVMIGRVIAGVGACAGMVLGRAMVRDVYEGSRAVDMLAYVSMALMMVPTMAPIASGWLLVWFDWRMPFFVSAAIALGLTLVCLRLRETHTNRVALPGFGATLRDFSRLMRMWNFAAPAIVLALPSGGFWAFLSLVAPMFRDTFGLPPTDFGYYFASLTLTWFIGSFLVTRLTPRLGGDRIALYAVIGSACCGVALLAVGLSGWRSAIAVFAPVALMNTFQAMVVPNLLVRALGADPRLIGAASGLAGFLQLAIGAIATFAVGQVYDGTARAGATALSLMCFAALAILLAWRRSARRAA